MTQPSPSTKITRRTILATVPTAAILGLAGCTGNSPGASNTSTGGNDTSHGGGGGGQVGEGHAPKAQLKMESVSTTDITSRMTMTVSQQTNHADLVSTLAQNGSASVKATSAPLPTDRPISYQKTVYSVSKNVTDQTSATRYTVAFSVEFDYLTQYERHANDVLTGIDSSELRIHNMDEFVDSILGDRRALRKMKSIEERGLYSSLDRAQVEDIVSDYDLGIEIQMDDDGEWGIHIPDMRKKWDVIRLLDDDHLESSLTSTQYQVYGKDQRS